MIMDGLSCVIMIMGWIVMFDNDHGWIVMCDNDHGWIVMFDNDKGWYFDCHV